MENEEVLEELKTGTNWLWFLGGCALSITTLLSVALLVTLLVSVAINVYLGWTMSGYEVSVSRRGVVSTEVIVVTPGGESGEVAAAPTPTKTDTPTPVPTSTPLPTDTPQPPEDLPTVNPVEATVEAQAATLAAIATKAAQAEALGTPATTPVVVAPPNSSEPGNLSTPQQVAPELPVTPASSDSAEEAPDVALLPLTSSTNTYSLIPIEGERESRPADEHADLNLKLRDPQAAPFEKSLVDIPGSGVDPNAPSLSSVFQPNFVATYAIHNWDWSCNCKGSIIQDGSAVLVGIKTTPGEPVFIPRKGQDIYQGKYFATVLYASEDSLTFIYARSGSVVSGYTVHYLGLQTDPNLIALFRESKGNELPGLTLDTPVGVATGELIVAIRDNGTFLDARSRRDWWD